MKPGWKELSARVDDLSLRERGLLFVTSALVVVMIAHAVALRPLLRQQRLFSEQIRQNQSQLASVQETLLKLAQQTPSDPAAGKRERVRVLELQLAESERALAGMRAGQASPERLPSLLRDMLGRERGVRMISLRLLQSVPVQRTAPGAAAGAAPSPGKPAPQGATVAGTGLHRHGLEIEISGGFAELVRYLEEVEALPWKLSWGEIDLKVQRYPEVRLRATLFVVSADRTLLAL